MTNRERKFLAYPSGIFVWNSNRTWYTESTVNKSNSPIQQEDYACIQEKDYTSETNVIVFSKVDTVWFCNRD